MGYEHHTYKPDMVSLTATQVEAQTQQQQPQPHDAGTLKLKAQQQQQHQAYTSASTSSDIHSSRLAQPLSLTDAFRRRGVAHSSLTPAIGEEFRRGQINLRELLLNDDEELLRELAVLGESNLILILPLPYLDGTSSSSSTRFRSPLVFSRTDGPERAGPAEARGRAPSESSNFPPSTTDDAIKAWLEMINTENTDTLTHIVSSAVSYRGVVFVRGQSDLTPALVAKLALKLGQLSGRPNASKLHIHPLSKEFSESGEFLGEKIDSERDEQGRQISFPDEKSELASAGWHTDISFEPIPSDYALLQLRTIPEECGGDTLWSSMYSAYDALSKPMQSFLEGLTATHDADMFREQADRYGFDLFAGPRGHPDNVGTRLRAVHPVIRTNPVTGWKGLYVNKSFTKRINELSKDESENLLNYLFRHIAENFNYQVRFKWERDDLA